MGYDFGMGLLQGVSRGIESYYDATKAREDREQRKRESELEYRAKGLIPQYDDKGQLIDVKPDPSIAGKKQEEQDIEFFKSGLIPKRDETGRIIGADVNKEYFKAKNESDPMRGLLQSYSLEKAQKESEQLKKGTKLAPDKVLLVQQGAQIPTALDDIGKTLEANVDVLGPVRGRAGQANPYDTRAQTIDAQVRAAAQMFGRYMEGGVLRKEDEEKYRKMFPNLSDPPQIAQNKLQIVRKLLTDKQNADVTALKNQGYDIGGFSTLPEQQSPRILRGGQPGAAQSQQLSPQDQQALEWAQANPQDPRADKIMQKLGVK